MSWLLNIEFLYPWFLSGIPLSLFGAGWQFFTRRKSKTLLLPGIEDLPAWSTWKTILLPYVMLLPWIAIASLCVALSRPRIPLQEENEKTEGIDIMFAMDISSSMLAKDFHPNRLEACKELAINFVNKRKQDRLGLIIFAGEAYTLCPLTTDHNVLSNMIGQVQIGILEDNTAIGMGLATAVKRLKDIESKSKIIILLTDGENNAGYIDPMTAADLAKTFQIKIYTIGVGTEGIAMTPSIIFGRGRDIPSRVSIDTKLLTKIAEETGGKFYRATDNTSLEKIYDTIDQLEKTEIEMNVYKRYAEVYRPFVYLSLLVFIVTGLLKYFVFNPIQIPDHHV